MIERLFPDPLAQQYHCDDPLGPYVDGFAEQLAGQGYTAATTKEKLRLITHLNRWLVQLDLPLPTLDQECRDAQDAKRDIPVPLSPSLVTTAY